MPREDYGPLVQDNWEERDAQHAEMRRALDKVEKDMRQLRRDVKLARLAVREYVLRDLLNPLERFNEYAQRSNEV